MTDFGTSSSAWAGWRLRCVGATLVVLLLAGCVDTEDITTTSSASGGPGSTASVDATSSTVGGVSAEEAAWTFMVYMIGDTDLEPFALEDLSEMAAVGSSETVNIVALVDRHPDYSEDGVENLPDWEDTQMLRVETDELVVLESEGELNMGSPNTLAGFVETAITTYPAERYALVLWDHGAGWPGMGPDETDDLDVLDLAEISQGLSHGLAAAGLDSLDLIGFDACLMATYEVASVISAYTDHMLASQELEPGHGWNYEALQTLVDDPALSAPDLGSVLISGFAEQAAEEGTDADITLSLLDLSAVGELQSSLSAIDDTFDEDPSAWSQSMAGAQRNVLEFGRSPDPELSTNQIDLGELLDNLVAFGDEDLAASAEQASAALDSIVLDLTTGVATEEATGLSIYFPALERYFQQGYLFLEDVPVWPDTLAEFYQSGDAIVDDERATFHPEVEAAVTITDEGLTVFGPMPDLATDSVVEATVSVGYDDEGELVYVAEIPAQLAQQDGVDGVLAEYDLTYMTISDGEEEALVYQSITKDPETGLTSIDIPLEYVAPGADPDTYQDALLSIVVDGDDNIVEEDFYVLEDSGTFGAMAPDPDGRIFPVALVEVSPDEVAYERTDDVGLSGDLPAIEYALEFLPSGTALTLDLTVWDYGGNGDYIAVGAEVP